MILRWKCTKGEVQKNQIIRVNNLYYLVTKVTEKLVFTSSNNRFIKKDVKSIMRAYSKTYNETNEVITVVPHFTVYQKLFKDNSILKELPEVVNVKLISMFTKLQLNEVVRIIDLFVPKSFIEAGNYKVSNIAKKTITIMPDFKPSRLLQVEAGLDVKNITCNTTFELKLRRNQLSSVDNYNKQYLLIN